MVACSFVCIVFTNVGYENKGKEVKQVRRNFQEIKSGKHWEIYFID